MQNSICKLAADLKKSLTLEIHNIKIHHSCMTIPTHYLSQLTKFNLHVAFKESD